IGGRDWRANGTRVANQTLTNGREYTARVEVRRDQVRAYLNDKLLVTHRTNGSDLSMLDLWRLPDAKSLGVGAYEADTTFHSIEVRQVSAAPAVASATPSNSPMPNTRPSASPAPSTSPSASPSTANAKTPAVLLVIANRDFYYREYADPRAELERAGIRVVVASATKGDCFPHPGSGQTGDGRVSADIALADAKAADYDAIVFSGGWGSSMYQFAFNGSYANAAYNGNRAVKVAANQLIGDFVKQDKYVAGICHGTSVLAWSRINGQSLLRGKQATGPMREGPAGNYNGRQSQPPSRWNLEANGARLVAPNSVGERGSAHDDVVVDGKVLTAQDDVSARHLGVVLARLLKSPN
ncbi:MAG: DJ-1/PfpI family protein, partial [Planctomycetales bacterium]|nr:DJ-1/PfpI family protein [Planctomycetales bacterium]